MGSFSLAASYFPRWEDHIVDILGEGETTNREVVGHVFYFGAFMSWCRGCVRPPFLRVDARGVDLRG
jgi:hypothetical protein